MKNQKALRIIGGALAIVMLTSTPAWALSSAAATYYDIGAGTTYYDVDGMSGGGVQQASYIEYRPSADISPLIAYGDGLYGTSTITKMYAYLEGQGKEVIGGINADFFDFTTGVPIGPVIREGRLISSADGQYAVGFKADGSAVIGKPVITMSLTGTSGNVSVNTYNKIRSKSSLCLLDNNFSAQTRISSAGTNLVLEMVDNLPITLNGSQTLRVISRENVSTSTPIGANQMVLTVAADGPIDRLPNFQIGEELTLKVTTADPDWAAVQYAVGGKSLLLNGTINTAGSPTGSHPRSAVGVKADGTVVLYEVDGRQSGYSVGLTPQQLAEEMQSLGCVSALNLDGGGSSAMLIQKPGEDKAGVITKPSGGSLRPCANYIMLVNNRKPQGSAARLHVYPAYKYALAGATVPLSVKATDDNYYSTTAPTNVTYQVSSGDGKIEGANFIAGSKVGQVELTATAGALHGSQAIHVIAQLTGLSVTKGTSNTAISTLATTAGESTDLHATGTYNASAVAIGNSSVTWTVGNDIGTISKDGVFTAGNKIGSGTITAAYGGVQKSVTVNVSLGGAVEDTLIADFESSQPFRSQVGSNISVVKQFDQVHNGMSALRVGYNLADNSSMDQLSCAPVDIAAGLDKLYLWVNTTHANLTLTANFLDADGLPLQASLTAINPPTEGYAPYSAAVPVGAVSFTGLTIACGEVKTGSFLLDQIILSSADKVDTLAPTITISKVSENPEVGGTVQVIASVLDNNGSSSLAEKNITVSVDGTPLTAKINAANGNVAFTTPALTAGIHRITITARDGFANLARKSIDVKAGSATTKVFSDTEGHWANDVINFVAARDVIKGETDKKEVSYFRPNRNLTRAEFAVIMARYLDLDTEAEVTLPYADLATIPSWALPSVKAVYAAGIMTGSAGANGKTTFNARDNIVRREVMTVVGKSLPRGYAAKEQSFTDSEKIPAWAAPHINYLVSLGIVGGYQDGSIAPQNNITRAEITKIIYGLY